MVWKISFDARAQADLKKLDQPIQRQIIRFLEERIASSQNPKDFGHGLTGSLSGLWRYRVRDYRIICAIRNETVTVQVISIGHRSNVYR